MNNWRIKFVQWGVCWRWPSQNAPHYNQWKWRGCLYCDRWAFWFHRRGDVVGWIWPWQRGGDRAGRRWSVATLSYSYFWTLREIDEFWAGYWRALDAAPKVQATPQEGAQHERV